MVLRVDSMCGLIGTILDHSERLRCHFYMADFCSAQLLQHGLSVVDAILQLLNGMHHCCSLLVVMYPVSIRECVNVHWQTCSWSTLHDGRHSPNNE